jgi:transcriptional regulator GlxA family with amidase domain
VTEALPILTRLVVDWRASRFAPPPAAAAALEIVRRTAGRIPCERVADTVGVSMRHLRRQVHDSTGRSPKAYARTLRLVHAMQLADAAAAPDWAAVAAQSGYCDQSHFIRECLSLTGLAPVPLHHERETQRVSERSNTR